jgi:hypothetical protein
LYAEKDYPTPFVLSVLAATPLLSPHARAAAETVSSISTTTTTGSPRLSRRLPKAIPSWFPLASPVKTSIPAFSFPGKTLLIRGRGRAAVVALCCRKAAK